MYVCIYIYIYIYIYIIFWTEVCEKRPGPPADVSLVGRQIVGYIEKGIRPPMAQGRSTKII